MKTHTNDVVVTTPKYIHELCIGDVVLLPVWGRSRVVCTPFFNPPSNRDFVTLIVDTSEGMKKLICTRNMCFQYEGYILD